jgi:hypothetical protein
MCELDLLCTAVVVVLVTSLIYFSEEIKKRPLGEKKGRKNNCFAKTPYKGVIRGNYELARTGRPHSQLRVPTCGGMSTADARGTYPKKEVESRSVACCLDLFLVLVFLGYFLGAPWICLGLDLDSASCSHDVSTGQNRFPEHNGLPRRGLLGGTSGWGPSTGGGWGGQGSQWLGPRPTRSCHT